MKQLKQKIGVVCAALVCVLAVSCSDERVSDYETVVPRDARVVVSMRLDNLVGKSDIINSPFFGDILRKVSGGMGTGVKEKVQALIDDPSLMGIDFMKPVYGFALHEELYGITMKVEDESLLNEFVTFMARQGLCGRVKESGGLSWSSLFDDGIRMVYNENTLLLMIRMGDRVRLDDKMIQSLMNLRKEDSFVSTPCYAQMQELRGDDIRLYFNLGLDGYAFVEGFRNLIPAKSNLSDFDLLAGVTVGQEAINMDVRLVGNKEKAQQQLDNTWKALKTLKGTYTALTPTTSPLWCVAGVHGTKLLEVMKGIPVLKEQLLVAGFGVDIDEIVRSAEGDLMFYSEDKTLNDFYVYAQLAKTDFMQDVDSWMHSASDYGILFRKTGENQYRLKGDAVSVDWAVNDNELYVGTTPYVPLTKHPSKPFEDEMKDALFFAYVGLQQQGLQYATVRSVKPCELDVQVQFEGVFADVIKGLVNRN